MACVAESVSRKRFRNVVVIVVVSALIVVIVALGEVVAARLLVVVRRLGLKGHVQLKGPSLSTLIWRRRRIVAGWCIKCLLRSIAKFVFRLIKDSDVRSKAGLNNQA